jgi:16S rRNA (uracil1498-N3)-methyltransferase
LSEHVVSHLDDDDAEKKRDKWQLVAVEAIKQCGAAWLPKIEPPLAMEIFLERREKFDLSLVGSLQKERRHPREVLREFESKQNRLPQNIAVWIGPEGDFTATELAAIQNSGALPVSLGRLVLRVETAAIYCLSFLNYELQRD